MTPSDTEITFAELEYELPYWASTLSPREDAASTSTSQYPIKAPSVCGWKDCSSSISSSNIEEFRAHLKCHAEKARVLWGNKKADSGMNCTWNGCTAKAKYRTGKLFEQHLVNIHINPLVCTVKGCSHTKPFRAKHELQRHIDSVHSGTPKYSCPFSQCTKGFRRKDKWMEHLFGSHDTERCPYAHCPDDNFVAGGERSTRDHIAKLHGIFECGLGCSEDGKASGFSDSALSEHLQITHKMEWATVLKARACAKSSRDCTLRIKHLS
jgi:hypothetical protein